MNGITVHRLLVTIPQPDGSLYLCGGCFLRFLQENVAAHDHSIVTYKVQQAKPALDELADSVPHVVRQ